jgi:hypothetical protein
VTSRVRATPPAGAEFLNSPFSKLYRTQER